MVDDANGEFRRVEVVTGPGCRRRWSTDEKAKIVVETLAPGARVSEVARRWQVCSQQIFGWRRTMRQDLVSVPGETTTPGFVPLVSETSTAATVQHAASAAPGIEVEVELAGAVVQVSSGMAEAAQLTGSGLGILILINVPVGARVLLATRPIDFRKGAHSLAALAQEVSCQVRRPLEDSGLG